ncbi:MAG: ATP-binding protein [Clostridiaceae bacterium]|nr:ATP-binding protein [Clostridiaceae bacterium]
MCKDTVTYINSNQTEVDRDAPYHLLTTKNRYAIIASDVIIGNPRRCVIMNPNKMGAYRNTIMLILFSLSGGDKHGYMIQTPSITSRKGGMSPMAITKETLEERINKTMVGRGSETELFQKQFDRVLEGGMGLTIVSGRPGIGKSFFVEHAVATLDGGATYVYGKFKQYDGSPMIAFSEIIEQTVRHILTLPAEALKNIKNDLNQKLGSDARLILSVCPYAQILFEAHKPVRTDNLEQLKYRVRKAVYAFLTAASTALFPLIIFIDDLQWADALSVSIVEVLCQDYECLNLHLVLAWREDEPGKVFLNPAKLPEDNDIRIGLGGLTYEDVGQYVRLVFEWDIEHKDYFIRMLY